MKAHCRLCHCTSSVLYHWISFQQAYNLSDLQSIASNLYKNACEMHGISWACHCFEGTIWPVWRGGLLWNGKRFKNTYSMYCRFYFLSSGIGNILQETKWCHFLSKGKLHKGWNKATSNSLQTDGCVYKCQKVRAATCSKKCYPTHGIMFILQPLLWIYMAYSSNFSRHKSLRKLL